MAVDKPTLRARLVLAEFIKRYSARTEYPYFYSVRGNCKKGLLRHLGVAPKYFAAVLLAVAFVTVRGGDEVRFEFSDVRDNFIGGSVFGLLGPGNTPTAGVSEITQCQVFRERLMGDCGDEDVDPNGKIDIYAIRMGKYGADGVIKAGDEINRGKPPPSFDPWVRSLQRWFMNQMRELVAPFMHDEWLPLIQKWVEVEELKEAPQPRGPSLPSPAKASAGAVAKTPSIPWWHC